ERQLELIQQSLEDVVVVTQEMPLLMNRMLSSISQFIDMDLPFHLEDRRARIQFAQDAINNPDVSRAEKFRQILSLYQIESTYGRTLETYPATLLIEGVERDVNMLRVGRIALAYQTQDREVTGA